MKKFYKNKTALLIICVSILGYRRTSALNLEKLNPFPRIKNYILNLKNKNTMSNLEISNETIDLNLKDSEIANTISNTNINSYNY